MEIRGKAESLYTVQPVKFSVYGRVDGRLHGCIKILKKISKKVLTNHAVGLIITFTTTNAALVYVI